MIPPGACGLAVCITIRTFPTSTESPHAGITKEIATDGA